MNCDLKNFFMLNDILFFTTRDPTTKAAICKRFIRTIKGIIFKYFTFSNSTKYINVLASIMHLYNNRVHSSIGISPSDVDENNVLAVWDYSRKKTQMHI